MELPAYPVPGEGNPAPVREALVAAVQEAETALAAGDLAAARRDLQRALEIRRASLGAAHPEVAEAQIGLAGLDARTGRKRNAFDLALDSERIARDLV